MTTKAHRLIPQILAAVLTLFGAAACSTTTASAPHTQAKEQPTLFKCVQQGSGWATMAEKGNLTTKSPLITWNTTEFGPDYTPENRCKIVSEKLTKAVANNGGKLGFLRLNVGQLNNKNVVCVVKDAKASCNSDNTLFTLNQKNSERPGESWQKIFQQFSDGKAGAPRIIENGAASILLENLVPELKDQSI